VEFFSMYFPNVIELKEEIFESTVQTIYMTGVTALLAGIFGIILGVALVVTEPRGILENARVYNLLDKIINLFRSIPFIIMLALIAPITRLILDTSIGTTAAIVPLIVGT